jgi:putative ABC transport system ATP-binding protein
MSDQERADSHQQQRDDQDGLASEAVAKMAEDQPAERPCHEAHAEGRERRQRSDRRIELRKEQLSEHQRRGRAVDEEVVPFERRAHARREQHSSCFDVHVPPSSFRAIVADRLFLPGSQVRLLGRGGRATVHRVPACSRFMDTLDTLRPPASPAIEPQANVVELSAVRFAWSPSAPLVIDIERLALARGERLFLRGPSGSGKSTLLSLLAGVVTARAGNVRVLERDLGALGAAERDRFRADHIGFIFQMFNLIPYLSVVENVCLPCGFSRRRRARALREGNSVQQEAVRLLRHLDMGDPGVLRRPVTELSVGQQQRVAAARALIGAPSSSSRTNRPPRSMPIGAWLSWTCCSASASASARR